MRRIDEVAGDLLSVMSEGWRDLPPESRRINQKWIVRLRKQIDSARILNKSNEAALNTHNPNASTRER